MRMVVHIMGGFPDDVFVSPTKNLCRGCIDERDLAVAIQPIDSLTRRVEDQLVLRAQLREFINRRHRRYHLKFLGIEPQKIVGLKFSRFLENVTHCIH